MSRNMNRLYYHYSVIVIAAGLIALGLGGYQLPELLHQPFFSWRDVVFFSLLGIFLNTMLSRLPTLGPHRAMAFLAPLLFLGTALTIMLAAGIGLIIWLLCLLGPLRDKTALCRESRITHFSYLRGVAQTWLALAGAGAVFNLLGGNWGQIYIPLGLLPPVVAALCLFLVEMGLEEIAVTLRRGLPFFAGLRNGFLRSLPVDASLAGLGLLLALLYQERQTLLQTAGGQSTHPLGVIFTLCIVLIPCWLLYYAYRLHLEMRRSYENTLRTLSGLVEARLSHRPLQGENLPSSPSTRVEKYRQVAEYAVAIAEQIGMAPGEVAQVRYAAYLLEVGKIGLPRELLSKNSLISPRQRAAYARHGEMGAKILEPVDFLRPVARLIQFHQARYDGLGHPPGIPGDKIPLGSRILSVALTFVEALRGEESGSPIASPEALTRLEKDRATRFDPKVIDALAKILQLGIAPSPAAAAPGTLLSPTVYFPW
jgi:hypothetical protein